MSHAARRTPCWQGRITSGSRFPRGDRPLDFLAGRNLGGFKIVSFLKIEPEFGGPTEPPCQSKRCVSRYGAATSNDFRHAVRWNTQLFRQLTRTHSEFRQNIFRDYLARVDRSSSWVIHRCFFRSVVINDFNGNCLGFSTAPLEADAPLIVDSNAELPGAISSKRLESVTRNDRQCLERSRRLDRCESTARGALEAGKCCDEIATSEAFGPPIAISTVHAHAE